MGSDGPVQFVLNDFIEGVGGFRFWIVVNAALGIDVGDLLIEPPDRTSFRWPEFRVCVQEVRRNSLFQSFCPV
jgi:hypothetical protein